MSVDEAVAVWACRISDLLDAVDVLNTPPPIFNALLPPDDELPAQVYRTRMAVLFQALHVVREAIGGENIAPVFQKTGDGPKDARGDLDWCMTILSALVRRNRAMFGPQTFDFAAVQEALAALNVGEVRSIFQPSPAPGKRSEAFTLAQHRLQAVGWRSFYLAQGGKGAEGAATLAERRNGRSIPHRMADCGYEQVRNPDAKDGRWRIGGRNLMAYAKRDLSERGRLDAVRRLQMEG